MPAPVGRARCPARPTVLRFHDLRHTNATVDLANRMDPKIVQERLGHANIAMTLDLYSLVTADMQKEAAERLEVLLDAAS
jgi:integrase